MLVGEMGAGNTAVASYLAERYGAIPFERTRLMHALCHALVDGAGDLDKLLERLLPADAEAVESLRVKLLKHVIHYVPDERRLRELHQQVVQIIQDHDAVAFEKELIERIETVKKTVGEDRMVVIEDMYTLAAFEFFAVRQFASIRIEAPEYIRRKRLLDRDGFVPHDLAFKHATETDITSLPCDITIVNDGSLDRLKKQVDAAVISLGNKG